MQQCASVSRQQGILTPLRLGPAQTPARAVAEYSSRTATWTEAVPADPPTEILRLLLLTPPAATTPVRQFHVALLDRPEGHTNVESRRFSRRPKEVATYNN